MRFHKPILLSGGKKRCGTKSKLYSNAVNGAKNELDYGYPQPAGKSSNEPGRREATQNLRRTNLTYDVHPWALEDARIDAMMRIREKKAKELLKKRRSR